MATKDQIPKEAESKEVEPKEVEQGETPPVDVNKALDELNTNLYDKKMLPKDAMGLNDEMIEGMYSFGYRLYNTGKYEQAVQLFRLLVMFDPSQPKFAMGLGACFHMMKDYENAATTYVLCSIIDPLNPLPHYHASDCYVQLNQPENAVIALQLSIDRCNGKEEFRLIKERAQLSLDAINEQLKDKTVGAE